MIILGIESSAVSAGAAVVKDGVLLAETYLHVGLTHSETLLTLADTCLKNAGLTVEQTDALAVAAGPGSFTGVRIGIALVKGLAFGANKPVYAVSTLEALASGAFIEDRVICPVMDARCGQVYTALFTCENGHLKRLLPDSALPLAELYALLQKENRPVLLLGDGAAVAARFLQAQPDVRFQVFSEIFCFQRAAGVAFAAYMRYNSGDGGMPAARLQPAYLRLPQAERDRQKKGENKA